MQFPLVSIVVLALLHSLLPGGVRGAPTVASDHADSLAVRQTAVPSALASTLAGLLAEIESLIQSLTGSTIVRRADSTPLPLATMSSHASAATQNRTGTSIVHSTPNGSSHTPQASTTPTTRARRQAPTSAVRNSSIVKSVATSMASVVVKKPGSATSEAAASKPTH